MTKITGSGESHININIELPKRITKTRKIGS